ncbi:glycoside hydrolase family 16 protein [Echinicola vietnamensis]|uniref:Beta-glucanase/beta-glucan synthetase n=1 Tax=Echinicola vietnamensis (strain DSM 17526 / LMG 23754 / KMM 6221) TaxID=926556 RepID=L0FS61_ECHVK|nr:glycoside hydrolase family 16 protein [Echinicola vietnamensis]AGA76774.1 beta-glucanase/beta-glucan synthetase [Echinicola vietnamensis DSM 17526]
MKQDIFLLAGLFFIVLSCIVTVSSAQDVAWEIANKYPGYTLVWSEEFNAEGKVNEAFWSFEQGFVRNHEKQYYQKANASVKHGRLVIEGRREEMPNERYEEGSGDWRRSQKVAEYTSASINTRGKKAFQYGIIEVKAKIDTAKGMWPAIWTLGTDQPWPSCGEVDIMEFYRVDDQPTILANAAWKREGGQWEAQWDEQKVPFSDFTAQQASWPDQFHVWKMEWTDEHIKLYLDEQLLNEIDLAKTTNPDGFNPFHQPHYILLNLAIGANGGDPSGTAFPRSYEVDYVRVYQEK